MRIARRFIRSLAKKNLSRSTVKLNFILRGSLAYTGDGHGTPRAVLLGALGYAPATIDLQKADRDLQALNQSKTLSINDQHQISFDPEADLIFDFKQQPELHPNEMECVAFDAAGAVIFKRTYYSTGGGFVASKNKLMRPLTSDKVKTGAPAPFPFLSCQELLALCAEHGDSIDGIILKNEDANRPRRKTIEAVMDIYTVMMTCIDAGLATEGVLPGGLKVQRRASLLWKKMQQQPPSNEIEQLIDRLNVYAMAVNEENAAGGKVVTAPTNGAAGIIPAILRQYCSGDERTEERIVKFLLTAGGIGLLYKQRASISGAEMGCQGEIGVACSMAAGGLAAIWGCSPGQIAQAAEIGMEHNLGLTCDPVGGLVQIPCIERNAFGAVKAVNAARMALNAVVQPKVSLDQVIETMRQTGLDMSSKYKETSQGGLAVNVVEC